MLMVVIRIVFGWVLLHVVHYIKVSDLATSTKSQDQVQNRSTFNVVVAGEPLIRPR
jgi:hypothetical protein